MARERIFPRPRSLMFLRRSKHEKVEQWKTQSASDGGINAAEDAICAGTLCGGHRMCPGCMWNTFSAHAGSGAKRSMDSFCACGDVCRLVWRDRARFADPYLRFVPG